MHHFIDAVRRSVQEKNWYAALACALALPDIAANLDGRPGRSRAKYVAWYNDYLLQTNTVVHDGEAAALLSGDDCYALRCAFLHLGDFDITEQNAQDVLDRFHFTVPNPGLSAHRNQVTAVLQLQVDKFCEEVCAAVEEWIRQRANNPDVAQRLSRLPVVSYGF